MAHLAGFHLPMAVLAVATIFLITPQPVLGEGSIAGPFFSAPAPGAPQAPLYQDINPAVLGNDTKLIFNVTAPPAPGGPAGSPSGGASAAPAFSSLFPALLGVPLSIVNFEVFGCGLVPAHIHPRAAELVYVKSGTLLVVWVDSAAGAVHKVTLTAGQITLIPQGVPHFQQEITNKPASFLAVLNSENPGLTFITKALFSFPPPDAMALLGINSTAAFAALNGTESGVSFPILDPMACAAAAVGAAKL